MQNDPHSHGLWEKTAPPAPAAVPLRGAKSADVVVIGGGYTGLSTALHLAEAGAKVTVLEAREIGFGGSGRNVGLVNAGMWVMPQDIPAALGAEYGERLLETLGDGPALVWELVEKHAIACEATQNGTLHCAVGPKGLAEIAERARQWAARGAPVTLLDAAEAERRIGSHAYAGALLDMRAGTIQPLAYVRGLARAAIAAGAMIHTDSAVTGIEATGPRWTVRSAQGAVSADWVVVATDAYTKAPWPDIRREQVHLPYFNFATTPLPPEQLATLLPGREGCWDTREVLSSFRLDQTGRLVFGSVGALSGAGVAIHQGWARRALRRLFPQIGSVAFEHAWYGMIGMTDDNLPRFHRLERNVIAFCGYNGRGIAPGTVFGRLMARHILGQVAQADLPLPLSDPAPARLRRVKEAYYTTGAQLAHLAGARF